MEHTESPLIAIVEAIAAREGTSESRLEPPLYEAVDTDALESLLAHSSDSRIEVRFDYAGYRVHLQSDGTFSVAEQGVTATSL